MSKDVELHVSRIIVQKDEYLTASGNLGETEFWRSNENQAEVLQLKRAIATCRIEGPFLPIDIELNVSLRAGYVRVRILNGDDGHNAESVARLLQRFFIRLHQRPEYMPEDALSPWKSRKPSKYMLCRTYDSHWLIATLHEAKDEKGFEFQLNDTELEELVAR